MSLASLTREYQEQLERKRAYTGDDFDELEHLAADLTKAQRAMEIAWLNEVAA